MGIKGMKLFVDRNNLARRINIHDEVNKWKRQHPGQTPIIVIDFFSVTQMASRRTDDVICGGRHKVAADNWERKLRILKETGCSLVFFSRLTRNAFEIDQLITRRNKDFELYTEVYDFISSGMASKELFSLKNYGKPLISGFKSLALIAKRYGEFLKSTHHPREPTIAQYAIRHNALAVISDTTEFFIFEGEWKLWWSDTIRINPPDKVTIIQYDRIGLTRIFSLSQQQLPLFATLLGNNFSKNYQKQMNSKLSSMESKADLVRKVASKTFTDLDIRRLTQHIFDRANDKQQNMIKESLNFYDIHFEDKSDDLIEQKLKASQSFLTFFNAMKKIDIIEMGYYDMKGCDHAANLPILLIDWEKRKAGFFRQRFNDDSFTMTLIAKKNINETFKAFSEKPIYPDFEVPPLDRLYHSDEDKENDDLIDTKWKIFGWIMSLPSDVIDAIKELPNEYIIPSVTLYALVKNKFITEKQADGILYTEEMAKANETDQAKYPTSLNANNVRAAHLYNIIYRQVEINIAEVGLSAYAENVLQFDGVYFQNLMEQFDQMNVIECEKLLEPFQQYRIYADNN